MIRYILIDGPDTVLGAAVAEGLRAHHPVILASEASDIERALIAASVAVWCGKAKPDAERLGAYAAHDITVVIPKSKTAATICAAVLQEIEP